MSNGISRSVKQAQVNMRVMDVQVNGTVATPTVTGIDASSVLSITDLGTGNYTVIFSRPFAKAPQVYFGSLTAGAVVQVTAIDYDRVTVQCTAAGVAADANFYMQVKGSDYGRYL